MFAKRIAFILFGCLCVFSAAAFAQKNDADTKANKNGGWSTISYDGIPVEITIQANEESILQFPWRVHLGSTSDMLSMVRNVPIGDSVYLTPLAEFDSERFTAEDPSSGAMILIDITASEDAPARMLRFVDNRKNVAVVSEPTDDPTHGKNRPIDNSVESEYSYSLLARYAFQTLYSPERVITQLDGVSAQPLSHPRSVNDIVPGGEVVATPIAEWVSGSGLYITALLLRNIDHYPLDLDPRLLRHTNSGKASAFWSTRLGAAGSFFDETTMVVISESSWDSSINQQGLTLSSDMRKGR